jgi:hypothetical protein
MVETLIKANEVEQFIVPIFGNKEITAVVAGQTVILTIDAGFDKKHSKTNHIVDRLHGILEGTGISSYKFAEDKKQEKELEEGKFIRNKA